MAFSLDEIDRYQRQVQLPGWGAAGQERVRAAAVVVRGEGPAARTAALYLAGAGVGALRVSGAIPEATLDALRGLNPHVAISVGREEAVRGPVELSITTDTAGTAEAENFELEAIVGGEDREAVGAACAVEALKRALGLPWRARVELPSPSAGFATPRLGPGRGEDASS